MENVMLGMQGKGIKQIGVEELPPTYNDNKNEIENYLQVQSFENKNIESVKRLSTSGKVLIGLTGGIAIGLSIVCLPFVAPAFRKYCLPYVPATTTQVENVLKALQICKTNINSNGILLDIGSGDGRIVIATAKSGYTSHGVELNPWLVQYSRFSAIRHGVFPRTKFFTKDLWKYDISLYKNIVIFGVEQMMEELEKKLINEVQENTNVIACRFPLPNRTPISKIGEGIDSVWIYSNLKKVLN